METIKQGKARASIGEQRVKEYLEQDGWTVKRANWHQEVREDIDLVCVKGSLSMTVSVKTQEAGLQHGHVYAELFEGMRRGSTNRTDRVGTYIDSIDGHHYVLGVYPGWLRFGRADVYAFVQGDELILIRKSIFTDLVDTALDRPNKRVLELSLKLRRRALQQRHPALWNESIYLDRNEVKQYADRVVTLTKYEELAA